MKISRTWLQTFFEAPLPDATVLADALTFHAFEIESVIDDVLDVKITANRGHDCLSHRGIAKELSAILNLPMKSDPLRRSLDDLKTSPHIELHIEVPEWAPVAAVAHIRGVTIGPSPEWLRASLEVIGQRSINNVVDATNFVMFHLGMPTHAFDASTFKDGDAVHYGIRASEKDETLTLLKGAHISLTGEEAVIMNAHRTAVDIGGVKGGATAELRPDTDEVILSASKFEPIRTRRTAHRFDQRTEAAKRFENEMADDLSLYGIRAVAELVRDIAGGEIVGYGIERFRTPAARTVSVSTEKVNAILATSYSDSDIASAFNQLGFAHSQEGSRFTVHPPFERLDLVIVEDLIEEVARIEGYEHIPEAELPPLREAPSINARFAAMEQKREELMAQGYSEIITSVFAEKGDRVVANKVDGVRPYLRSTLLDGLKEAYERNNRNKDVLGLAEIKLFEIGTVWQKGNEEVMIGMVDTSGAKEMPLEAIAPDAYQDLPVSETIRYMPFSRYPHISRDIALWVPAQTSAEHVLGVIRSSAGELLRRCEKFDEFKKGERVSYAFRLVFQSFDKTLTDFDANERMESIYKAVKEMDWEVR